MNSDRVFLCRFCGILGQGRPDQIFCSNSCRYNYHNWKKSQKNSAWAPILNPILKNDQILDDHYNCWDICISRSDLEKLGFTFTSFIGECISAKNVKYYCFGRYYLCMGNDEQAYQIIPTDEV
jgi:hypothetical protein